MSRYLAPMTTFALIGSGWRARMFLDVARDLGTVRCGGVVVRTPRELEVPTFTSLQACLGELRPDFVLTATPWRVTPGIIAEAVDRGVPVLAETPPAPDLDGREDPGHGAAGGDRALERDATVVVEDDGGAALRVDRGDVQTALGPLLPHEPEADGLEPLAFAGGAGRQGRPSHDRPPAPGV